MLWFQINERLLTSFNQRLRIVWLKDCRFFYFERLLILSVPENRSQSKFWLSQSFLIFCGSFKAIFEHTAYEKNLEFSKTQFEKFHSALPCKNLMAFLSLSKLDIYKYCAIKLYVTAFKKLETVLNGSGWRGQKLSGGHPTLTLNLKHPTSKKPYHSNTLTLKYPNT